ncbi:hypothetical protein BGW80DRAFT_687167 [Lactifluus volemus]|nr:hypothetical protein BGW80DRAFT_687167 [Lactifluus volemus]
MSTRDMKPSPVTSNHDSHVFCPLPRSSESTPRWLLHYCHITSCSASLDLQRPSPTYVIVIRPILPGARQLLYRNPQHPLMVLDLVLACPFGRLRPLQQWVWYDHWRRSAFCHINEKNVLAEELHVRITIAWTPFYSSFLFQMVGSAHLDEDIASTISLLWKRHLLAYMSFTYLCCTVVDLQGLSRSCSRDSCIVPGLTDTMTAEQFRTMALLGTH